MFCKPRNFGKIVSSLVLLMSSGLAAAGPLSFSSDGLNWIDINPIKKSYGSGYYDAAQYYGYNTPYGASANTPDGLEQPNTLSLFLFRDGSDNLSLFQIVDKANDGSGASVQTQITSAGLAGAGLSFIVRDDPGDSSYVWNDATGSANLSQSTWPCCTDGFVLGYLPTNSLTDWSLTLNFSAVQGINAFKIFQLSQPFESGPSAITSISVSSASALNNGITFSHMTASVPEPAALPMLLLGAIGLGRMSSRKRAAAKISKS
mgnify:CR=1 FL=1